MAKSLALGHVSQLQIKGMLVFLVLVFDKPMISSQSLACIPTPFLRKLTVYLELIPNVNLIPVAGRDRPINPNVFGTVFAVVDVPVRLGVSTNSTLIGRAGGLLVVSSISATTFTSTVSMFFENGAFSGSTMEFRGFFEARPAGRFGELAINGGTKCLRFVTGYAISRTIQGDPATNNNFINQVDINYKYDLF